MVGGAPVNQRFAQEIGADGYGHDAAAAVDLTRDFLKNRLTHSA
jgi:5-methyltetrahydrofolate--homocysteine methyltransferase